MNPVLSGGGMDWQLRMYGIITQANLNTVTTALPEAGLPFAEAVTLLQGLGFTHTATSPQTVSLEDGVVNCDYYGNNNQKLDREDYSLLIRDKRLYVQG